MGEGTPGRPSAGERLAAAAALLGAVAATALVLAEVARNVVFVLVAALSLLLCAFAGWYLVSRRGPVRLAATAVLAGALALLVSSVVLADITVWALALAFALSVASVAAARHALRRSPRALNAAAGRKRAVTAARSSGPDHEPEVRRREGAAVRPGRGVPSPGHRAGSAGSRR